MTKFLRKRKKKKKRFHAIMLQIHFKCMKSLILIQFNPKRRKHEKTHPFINFRLAFSFRIER
ncbi:hypothetical protein C2R84_03020 [Helicobacter pylori]|nr:hypothetical protein C2R84_03020 [Helicobacter pylori]